MPLCIFGLFTLSVLNSSRVELEILIPKKVCSVENGDVVVLHVIVIVNNPINVFCFNRGAGC